MSLTHKRVWFSRNPEDRADCSWFTSEAEAYRDFLEWGDRYLYTEINEGEGTAVLLNEQFAGWAGPSVDLQSIRADREYSLRREAV